MRSNKKSILKLSKTTIDTRTRIINTKRWCFNTETLVFHQLNVVDINLVLTLLMDTKAKTQRFVLNLNLLILTRKVNILITFIFHFINSIQFRSVISLGYPIVLICIYENDKLKSVKLKSVKIDLIN